MKFQNLIKTAISILLLIYCLSGCGSSGSNFVDNNQAPQLTVSDDIVVAEYDTVVLSGHATDTDGQITAYDWEQTGGVQVYYINSDSPSINFVTPQILQDEIVRFRLKVTDNEGATTSRNLKVTIKAALLVPDEFTTIQEAINTAKNGEIVLVRPGIYFENLVLSGKQIHLASSFILNEKASFIAETTIDGNGNAIINIGPNSDGSSISGFTIQNGPDGIVTYSFVFVSYNKFENNGDGIDYESGSGGTCEYNSFINNSDDGVDIDGAVDVVIFNNSFTDNLDDGIEIRLHPYTGQTLEVTISGNDFSGNQEDGIQIIGYPGVSNRKILIERNIIINSTDVAIGFMDNGITLEDTVGAPVPEPVYIINNTLVNNNYGITGGANAVILNNIIAYTTNVACRNNLVDSIVAFNLFWDNGTDYENSIIDIDNTLFQDPLFDAGYTLQDNSPAIDAGVDKFIWNGVSVLSLSKEEYDGTAPDIGALE